MTNKNRYNNLLILGLLVSIVIGIYGCSDSGTNASDLTGITDFSLQSFENFEFTVDQSTLEVTNSVDSLPYGTDPSSLIAEFETVPQTTVTVNGVEQISGSTANDFTNPLIYTATAEDGSTTKEYLVTVTVAQQNPEAVSWAEITPDAVWGPFTGSLNADYIDSKLWVLGITSASFAGPPPHDFGVYSSTDGAGWTEVTATADDGTAMPAAGNSSTVHFDDKLWLVGGHIPTKPLDGGGYSFDAMTNKAWYTTDGTNWTMADPGASGFSARENHAAVVFNDQIFVIGGNGAGFFGNIGAPLNDVWSSTDGQTWTQVTAGAAFEARYDPAVFVFDGKIWLCGGKKQDGTLLNDVWNSTDGVTWTEVSTTNVFTPRFGHAVVVYDGRLWLIGGEGSEGGARTTYNDLWISEDGTDWQKVAQDDVKSLPASFAGRAKHEAFVYNDIIWIMGGYSVDAAGTEVVLNDVWRGRLNGIGN